MENVNKPDVQTRIVDLLGSLPAPLQTAFVAGYDLGASQSKPSDDDQKKEGE